MLKLLRWEWLRKSLLLLFVVFDHCVEMHLVSVFFSTLIIIVVVIFKTYYFDKVCAFKLDQFE